MRRELRKHKDLIKELYSIIVKYLPELLNLLDHLTDDRNQNYVTYKMKTICVTKLFGLLCGLTTITDISYDKFNSDNCIKNLSKICNQKHRTLDITHLNSKNDTAMKNHYFFIQFAHTIRQLLEQGSLLTKSLKLKIKEVSEYLLHTLTSTTSDLNNIETNFQLRFDT